MLQCSKSLILLFDQIVVLLLSCLSEDSHIEYKKKKKNNNKHFLSPRYMYLLWKHIHVVLSGVLFLPQVSCVILHRICMCDYAQRSNIIINSNKSICSRCRSTSWPVYPALVLNRVPSCLCLTYSLYFFLGWHPLVLMMETRIWR